MEVRNTNIINNYGSHAVSMYENRQQAGEAECMYYMSLAHRFMQEIGKVIRGKDDKVEMALTAIFAGGHILLEDHPGVGKTTLAKAIRSASEMDYKRVQFTPDTMPSDISGFTMYVREKNAFEFQQGPVFTNLLLGDEINRTSPKTQAALLEAMEERAVTMDGVTMALPDPFIVIATENPSGVSGGTQALPDSQKDRFMIRMSMGYMDEDSEVAMLREQKADPYEDVKKVLKIQDLKMIRHLVSKVYVSEDVLYYIVDLANAVRQHPMVENGLSHRSSLALLNMAKARSFMQGRRYAYPEDVAYVYEDVIAHRLSITNAARAKGETEQDVVREVLDQVAQPALARRGGAARPKTV